MINETDAVTTILKQPIWLVLPVGAALVPAGAEVKIWHEPLTSENHITKVEVIHAGLIGALGGGFGEPGRIRVTPNAESTTCL